jgi:hypothetical protein
VKALKNEWMGVSHKRAEAFPSIVAVTRTVRRRMGTMCVCNDVVPSRRVQLARRPCLRLRGRRSEGENVHTWWGLAAQCSGHGYIWLGRVDSINSHGNNALVVTNN